MTVCLYGSEPQSGSPDWFTYEVSDLVSWLPKVFGFVTYGLMGLPTAPQKTADFCAVEPSGDLPTTADYAKLAFPPIALISGTYQRFGNQVRQDKFNALCQCAANPSAQVWCIDWSATGLVNVTGTFGASYTIGYEITIHKSGTLDRIGFYRGGVGDTEAITWFIWNRATGVVLATGTHPSTATTGLQEATIALTVTAGETIMVGYNQPSGWPGVLYSIRPTQDAATMEAGDRYFTNGISSTMPTANETTSNWSPQSVRWVGSGSPTAYPAPPAITTPTGFPDPPAAPTCTTEQDICNNLTLINRKLDVIDLEINALQRFGAPMNYTLGAPHNLLTGNGSISASGILGALVSLTTVPTGWGRTSDTPPRYVPTVGAIQAESTDGYSDWEQVHYTAQMVMFRNPWATAIHYSFRPGITATVTPLLAPL